MRERPSPNPVTTSQPVLSRRPRWLWPFWSPLKCSMHWMLFRRTVLYWRFLLGKICILCLLFWVHSLLISWFCTLNRWILCLVLPLWQPMICILCSFSLSLLFWLMKCWSWSLVFINRECALFMLLMKRKRLSHCWLQTSNGILRTNSFKHVLFFNYLFYTQTQWNSCFFFCCFLYPSLLSIVFTFMMILLCMYIFEFD